MYNFGSRFDQESGSELYSNIREDENNLQDGGGKDSSTNSDNWKKLYLFVRSF